MLVFNTEMHVLTFVFICLEIGIILFYQLPQWLMWPNDRSRFGFLILFLLLVVYNLISGLLPDKELSIPFKMQNDLAYGSGFMMGAYFPYFFYDGLGIKSLRRHALIYSPLFIILPYLIFFLLIYSWNGDLAFATSYGMILPFLYSLVILYVIPKSVNKHLIENKGKANYTKLEIMTLYFAVMPWVTLSVFSFLHSPQWLEALCNNIGFLLVTAVFMAKSIREDRMVRERLANLASKPNPRYFEANIQNFGFTSREQDVINLLRMGLTKQEIGEKLFIAQTTVSRHTQNIYLKAEVKSRVELIHKLELPS